MNLRAMPSWSAPGLPWSVHETLSLAAGLAFTFGIFLGMAHIDVIRSEAPPPEIADVMVAAASFEAPPPKPAEYSEPTEVAQVPLTGIDAGPSDSPVKIAVVPPELSTIFPESRIPPSAMVQFGRLFPDAAPRLENPVDTQRVYLKSEVDRAPTVLSRQDPNVPTRVRADANILRVTLLLLIDPHGQVTNVKVLKTSNNPEFDQIVADSVRATWIFTPAVKKGKNVRCLAEQIVAVKWAALSPFETTR